MIRKIRFQPLAAAEVVEAQLLYENRVPGLGDRLMGAVQGTTEGAVRWPNAGTPTRNDAMGKVLERKVATPGFPYVVVYRVTDLDIEVLAVHHERRRPLYWVARTDE